MIKLDNILTSISETQLHANKLPRQYEKVIILRKCLSYEGGWDDIWNPDMDFTVGNIGRVEYLRGTAACPSFKVSVNGDTWWYPYFVLKKIEV